MEDAWKWMNRARSIESNINALSAAKENAKSQVLRITPNYGSDGSQSSKNPHKYDRLVELESLIDQKIDEQLLVKQEILTMISRLQDTRQQAILTNYYINMMTLEEIATKVRYSYPHVKRLRAKAMVKIQEILNEDEVDPQ